MKYSIEIRAHHLLCIPRFYHGGYDHDFATNMKTVCQYIRKNPLSDVKVLIAKPDVLCLKCPYLLESKCVQSKEIGRWVESQDRKVAQYLGLKHGQILIAKDAFNLSMERVNEKTIEFICSGCIFLDNCIKVGINNSFRKELNKKSD